MAALGPAQDSTVTPTPTPGSGAQAVTPTHGSGAQAVTPTPGGGAQATDERLQQGRGRPRKATRIERDLVVRVASVESTATATHTTIEKLSPSFTLVVPNELLERVHKCKGDYMKVINENIEGGMLQLDETSTRLRKSIMSEAGRLHSRVTTTAGTKRMTLLEKSTRFLVGKGEAVNIHEYCSEMESYKVCLQAT